MDERYKMFRNQALHAGATFWQCSIFKSFFSSHIMILKVTWTFFLVSHTNRKLLLDISTNFNREDIIF